MRSVVLRSLSDIDRSTAAYDPRPSASCLARKNPPCIVFQRIHLRFFRTCASYLAAPPSPRHEGNFGQAPRRQKEVPTEENTTIQNETSTAGAMRMFKCLA